MPTTDTPPATDDTATKRDAQRWRAARTYGVILLYGAHSGWSYDGDADADFTIAQEAAGDRGETLSREAFARLPLPPR